MRDLLTILGALVVALLAALLAVPPLVDWPAHRDVVDDALTRALGQPVRTAGALDLRLLPAPRLRAERVRIGPDRPDAALLDGMYVRAEIALAPLLGGEVKIRESRIGRAEIRLPTGAGGDWRVPASVLDAIRARALWSVDGVSATQFLLTTVDPRTGRTDQVYADDVRLTAPSLAGPWRLDGRSGDAPFEITVGELDADGRAALKFAATQPASRFKLDADGRLDLVTRPDGDLEPRAAGTVRLTRLAPPGGAASFGGAAPPGGDARPVLPVAGRATFKAAGREIALGDVSVEAGDGVSALRLSGSGRYDIDAERLALTLAGRRFDWPAFRTANASALGGTDTADWRLAADPPVDLALSLDALVVPAGEVGGITAALALGPDGSELRELRATGAGGSVVRASGAMRLGDRPGGTGSVTIEARDGGGLKPFVESAGFEAAAPLLEGRPVAMEADITVAPPVLSVRNLHASVGEASASGTIRYTAAEAGTRPRLDAQVALRRFDVAAVGDGRALLHAARTVDLGLAFDARDVGFSGPGSGHVSGRIATDGPALAVEGLEVRDLAGAEASLAGRIAPDGSGRIAGTLKARRVAPLADLFAQAWLGDLAAMVPAGLRDGPADLAVALERPSGTVTRLRTTVSGRLAGGRTAITTEAAAGRVDALSVDAETDRSDLWLGTSAEAVADLRRPGEIRLQGRRDAAGTLRIEGRATLADMSVATTAPVGVPAPGDPAPSLPVGGGLDVRSADVAPFAAWLMGAPVTGPLPVRLALAPPGDEAARGPIAVRGEIAGTTVAGGVTVEGGRAAGDLVFGRLSLPALLASTALDVPAPAARGAWPTGRFGPPTVARLGGTFRITAAQLDLGPDWAARDAAFSLETGRNGIAIRDARARVGDGEVRGSLTLDRQGGLAALLGDIAAEGVAAGTVLGPPFDRGRIGGSLHVGASGESVAALVANLGGAGSVTVSGTSIAGADPGAPARVAARVAGSDDPIASQRWLPLLGSELDRAPLVAGPVSVPTAITAGALRLSPLALRSEAGDWSGTATIDLRTASLDARGILRSRAAPPRWTGEAPAIGLAWTGPLAHPARVVDPAPLVSGLAALVLERELDRIDTFDLDAAEAARRNGRLGMDRARREREEAARREVERRAADSDRAPSLPPVPGGGG